MRTLLCCLVAGLASIAPAQTHVTSPRGFVTNLAPSVNGNFGGDSFGRVMFFDGELRNTAMSVKEIAYRPKGSVTGRTWSNVDLYVSNCDVDRVTTTFRTNPTSTPSLVFRSSITWPHRPLFWNWSIHFPFKVPWVYAGTEDICLDYDFSGGTLHNQTVPWFKLFAQGYVLDGYDVRDKVTATERGFGGLPGCKDSNAGPPAFRLIFSAFGPADQNHDKFEVVAIARTAPFATAVIALGPAGDARGFPFPGVTCENVHLDFAKPVTLFPGKAGRTGGSNVPPGGAALIPYDSTLVGTDVWGQAAWSDTGNGAFLLTPAVTASLPQRPKSHRRKVLYERDNLKKYGTGVFAKYADYSVVARYAK